MALQKTYENLKWISEDELFLTSIRDPKAAPNSLGHWRAVERIPEARVKTLKTSRRFAVRFLDF